MKNNITIKAGCYAIDGYAGKTVGQLKRKYKKLLEIPDGYCVAVINGKQVRSTKKLKPGDTLQFIQMYGTYYGGKA